MCKFFFFFKLWACSGLWLLPVLLLSLAQACGWQANILVFILPGSSLATDKTGNDLINKTCMLSCFSHVRLCVALYTIACQAPLSMGLPRQGYWSGLLFPSARDLHNPEIKPEFPSLAGGFFTTEPPWKPFDSLPNLNNFVVFLTLYIEKNKKVSSVVSLERTIF